MHSSIRGAAAWGHGPAALPPEHVRRERGAARAEPWADRGEDGGGVLADDAVDVEVLGSRDRGPVPLRPGAAPGELHQRRGRGVAGAPVRAVQRRSPFKPRKPTGLACN